MRDSRITFTQLVSSDCCTWCADEGVFFNKFGDVSCLVIDFDTADPGFLVRMPLDPLQELQDRALYGWVWAQV